MPRLAVVLAFIASLGWILFPAYVPHQSLVQANGLRAAIVLAAPVILGLWGLFSGREKIAGGLLLLFCSSVLFLSGILLGLSYLPAAILLFMPHTRFTRGTASP